MNQSLSGCHAMRAVEQTLKKWEKNIF